ncbi:tRNA (adenosine(37)-N6)-threonylcarbamoyltransferase complex ATPase subunit type 1 TsaE [Thiocystis violacea]|uniref:tRNA (adenosine(37)-N6)-threonylcarbamoyltransferase complex ATPase subunit type 1 TsaE n=1 Tax=Thiocystis violacea TaxID=13725 RepID=UPI001905DC32|nr:tRNA (adenosine(37)-N6)-threonylcarbamoyltransferase complex ATPase subunit type 1 TsaE [Thiocystis violacea]MBK1719401.1 tRNA (adenosine(37)-N6)-threonylcarbamoyltransferase complex ATPase subunit type 1 TsaE [Thiocystis violacea]
MELWLPTEEAQIAFGEQLACALKPPCVIFLEGDLGTGKTTLARGILRGLGHQGAVRSPTYTLIEPYELARAHLYHFDLYRLDDPEELEYLGLRDLLGREAIWLLEWPERGAGLLPKADLLIRMFYQAEGRSLSLTPVTSRGETILAEIGDYPSRQA